MNLRELTRRTATGGATVFATVLETALGRASVQLVDGGSKLSNLPVVGRAVKPGQRVVVDYSAEGTPTVRPLTIDVDYYAEDDELEEAERIIPPEPVEEVLPIPEPELIFYPVTGRMGRYSPTTIASGSPYGYLTLDKTYHDTHDAWNGYNWTAPQNGTYMISATVGYTYYGGSWGSAYLYIDWNPGVSDWHVMGYQFRRASEQKDTIVVTTGGLFRVLAGDNFDLRVGFGLHEGSADIVLPVSTGKYPICHWWKIAPIIGQERSPSWPMWYWWDSVYE